MSRELWPTPMSRLDPGMRYEDFVFEQEPKDDFLFDPRQWLRDLKGRIGMAIAPLTLDVTHHSFDSVFDINSSNKVSERNRSFLRRIHDGFRQLHRAGL